MSPTLGRSICLAQLDAALAAPGTTVTVRLPDGRLVPARVTEHHAHVDPEGARLRIGSDSGVGPVRDCGTPTERTALAPTGALPTGSTGGGPTVTDAGRLSKVLVRAAHDGAVADALGVRFGRAGRDPYGALVVGSGPGEWLVVATNGRTELADRLEKLCQQSGEFASVVDLTHGRALLRLQGAAAADVLATLCAIDLSDDVVPDGAALRTSVAKVVTDLVRDDVSDRSVPSYLLHCERSSGRYLLEALLDAGAAIDQEGTT